MLKPSSCSQVRCMDFSFERLQLDEIDFDNTFYRITTTEDKPPIIESVGRIGLICPVVIKVVRGRYSIVSGFRRIQSCRLLGQQTIPCLILPNSCDEVACAELTITENLTQRSLNIVEQARCLQILTMVTGHLKDATSIANALGLSLNRDLVTKLKTILASPEMIRTGIIKGKLSLNIALAMSELSPKDAVALAKLFDRFPMGQNKQREILQNLREIAARDNTSLRGILEEEPLKVVLDDGEMDGNQKSHALRSYCRKRRFPRIVQTENAFHGNVKKLRLGDAIQLSPPPGFEGSFCTMSIRIESLKGLIDAHRKITEVLKNPALEDLFNSF